MSTDDADRPLTRAELRARRAAEDAPSSAPEDSTPPQAPELPASLEPVSAASVTPDDVPVIDPRDMPDSPAPAPAPAVPPVPVAPAPVNVSAGPGPRRSSDDAADGAGSDSRFEPPAWEPHPTPEPVKARRRFPLVLGAVLAALVLVVAGFGVITLLQGPRISSVKVERNRSGPERS